MKIKKLITSLVLGLLATSCIQDEALNSEAAIDACAGDEVQLASIDPESKTVTIYISQVTDLSSLQLEFFLPEGATIEPAQASAGDNPPIYDFSGSSTREFIVTSEDGEWKTSYSISIVRTELPTIFHFDALKSTSTTYDIFYEFQAGTSTSDPYALEWASGNPGYKLTGMAQSASDYPTTIDRNGVSQSCVRLETKSTGSFGSLVGMPIAAGNIFIGSFDVSNALSDPLKATQIGYPFLKIPVALKGYFKYKPGDVYKEGENVVDKTDRFDIYAIFYETDDQVQFLDGDNRFESDHLVKLARIQAEDAVATDTWEEFYIPFETVGNRSIDTQKLAEGKYKVGIVFSSSIEGDLFNGAVGSTLYIDEVELIYE